MDDELKRDESTEMLAAVSAERDALASRVTELEAQTTTLTTRWQESVTTGALSLALQRQGCRDVEAALLLLDRTGVALAEDGRACGVEEAVAALRQARGYLFAPQTLGGAVNPAGRTTPANPAAAFATWLRGG